MKTEIAAMMLAVAATPALAHRLDEYLQGTILSVEKNHMQAEMTLTPGVAIFPVLIAALDTDADGAISEAEQRAYAVSLLRDLSLAIDGHPLTPRLLSVRFPAAETMLEEMRQGRGEIRIEFDAYLPAGGRERKLTLENHHQSRISAYQVNCLVPRDPEIRIVAQNRNYTQSSYELDFIQADQGSHAAAFAWIEDAAKPLGTAALLIFGWLALLLGSRSEAFKRLGVRRRGDA